MIKHTLRTTVKKVNGDCLTPVLIFNRLKGSHKFLLESSIKHETTGRYSFIGVNPRKTYTGAGTTLIEYVHANSKTYSYEGDLVHLMKQVMPRISNDTEYPFTGGAIGYIRFNRAQANIPAVQFHVYDTIVIYDHVKDELTVIHTDIDAEKSRCNIDDIIEQIVNGSSQQVKPCRLGAFKEQTSLTDLEKQVQLAQEEMQKSDVQQVVLSRKQIADFEGDAFALYRELRVKIPSPFMYYIEFNDHTVIGASPESIVQVHDGELHATTATNLEEVCVKGSIQKDGNQISASLLPTLHAIDALTHLLPADSVTGVPHEQAKQIIAKAETAERDLFGGAIGYIGFNGQLDFTLASHTVLVQQNEAMMEIGTTITAESDAKALFPQEG